MSNLTKKDIYQYLTEKKGFSNLVSKKIINNLIEILITNLRTENLNIKNFGLFRLIEKKERIGRNPKTKQAFKIKAQKTIVFNASRNIKKILND